MTATTINAAIRLTISEFSDLETVIGAMETDGTEDLRLYRNALGELLLAVDRPGDGNGSLCTLSDWAAGLRSTH